MARLLMRFGSQRVEVAGCKAQLVFDCASAQNPQRGLLHAKQGPQDKDFTRLSKSKLGGVPTLD